MLSCLSYNVFLGKELDSLLPWLYVENDLLDLYCFQEFPRQKIPDIKTHLDRLGYDFQFVPGFVRCGVTYGELTAFRKSKLKLLKAEIISLGGKGESTVVFTHNGLKIFRVDKMKVDKSALLTDFQYQGRDFTLVNAHLSTDLHNARKLRQLKTILQETSTAGSTVILGDFNYAIGKRKLERTMNTHGFKSGLQNQKTFRFASGIHWQSDFIFQRECEVKKVSVDNVTYSDHYPVFFELNFGREL